MTLAIKHHELDEGENPFSCGRACEFLLDDEGNVLAGKISEGSTASRLLVAPIDNGEPDYSSMWEVPVGRVTQTWAW